MHLDAWFSESVALLPGTNPRLAATPARIGIIGDAFCIWSAQGKLEYLEYMGEEVEEMDVLIDKNGRSRAIVATATRLLLAP